MINVLLKPQKPSIDLEPRCPVNIMQFNIEIIEKIFMADLNGNMFFSWCCGGSLL